MKMYRKKGLVRTATLSYIVMILICILVATIIISQYEKIIKKETDNLSTYLLSSVSQSVHEVLGDMQMLTDNILRDVDMNYVVQNQNKEYNSQLQYAVNSVNNLKMYIANQRSSELAFVYLKTSDQVLSIHGILKSQTFYDIYFKDCSITYEEWLSSLKQNDRETYITLKYNNAEPIDAIAILSPFSADKDAVSVILADKRRFLRDLDKDDFKNAYDIYVYNSYERLIFFEKNTKEAVPYTMSELHELMMEDTESIYTVNDIAMVNDWYVAIGISKKALNMRIAFMRLFVIIIFLITIIALTFLLKYIVEKSNRHLKRLMSILKLETQENEYQNLYSSVKNILGENNILQKEYKKKSLQLKKIYLSQLITGDEVSLDESYKYEAKFSYPYFATITFYLEDIHTLFKEEKNLKIEQRKEYLKYIIANIVEESFENNGVIAYVTEASGMNVCLVNAENDTKEYGEKIFNIAKECLTFINGHFNLKMTFSQSEIYEEQSGIVKSFAETMDALEYMWKMSIEDPLKFSDIEFDYSDRFLFDSETQRELVCAIKSGNVTESNNIIEEILRILDNRKGLSSEYVRYTLSDVLTTVTKASVEAGARITDVSKEIDLFQSLQNEKLPVIKEKLKEHIKLVCKEVERNDVGKVYDRKDQKIQNIIEYVEDNFQNPALNVTAIGEYFDMSPFYISKLFKEKMGMTLVDYINKCRISRARELMETTNYSVKHIAEQVGFNHARTFYRILKKHTE